jgi:hypothetical protein
LRTIVRNNETYINLHVAKARLYINDVEKLIDEEYIVFHEKNKDADDDGSIIGDELYGLSSEIKCVLEKCNSHPEHYNAHKILGIKVKYRKNDELRILADTYKHFRADYNIIHQYPFLEFYMDAHIVLEITQQGGIVIEIDDNNHKSYSKKDNEDR